MRLVALVLALLLAGCAEPAADNYGWGWSYDSQGPTGLRLRYEPDVRPDRRRELAAFETAWLETAACVGLDAPRGPLVVVTANAVPCDGHAGVFGGCAYPDTRTAVVHAGLAALRHEYVHLLLHRTDHNHHAFDTCGQPGLEAVWPWPFTLPNLL